MKPICVKCHRFYKPKKSGFYFMEGKPKAPFFPEPGTQEAFLWEPYKLWVGDLYECAGCGSQIITGFGLGPIAEHYQEGFEKKRAMCDATFQVNDC